MDTVQAIRDLSKENPLKDEQIRSGIIDWLDMNPEIASKAAKLHEGVDDIAPTVWNFKQERQDELPDPEISYKAKGLFSILLEW